MIRTLAVAALALSACASAAATASDPLEDFLSDQFANSPGSTMSYMDAAADLNGDGVNERLVYLTGPGWCGSGGCTLLVLKAKGKSFETVTSIPVTRPPVRVLDSATNGWRDIGVRVEGGGIQPGYEAVLPFDGTSYPRNPTVEPARPSDGTEPGATVIRWP